MGSSPVGTQGYSDAANQAASFRKTIVVADSHTKLAAFMTWLAEAEGGEKKVFRFPKSSAIVGSTVTYVDFGNGGLKQRAIGVESDNLSEPLLYPMFRNAAEVAFLVSRKRSRDEPTPADHAIANGPLLTEHPVVHCLFSADAVVQRDRMKASLNAIGVVPQCPSIDFSEFKQLWTHLFGPARPTVPAGSQLPPYANPTPASPSPAAKAVPATPLTILGDSEMANVTESLASIMQIDGALGCFIGDYASGMLLAQAGGGMNLDVAAAGNTEVIKAKMKTMEALGLNDSIEDILITLGKHYHIMRPMAGKPGLFLYVALDKSKANLAMARFKLLDIEKSLSL